MDPFDVAFVKGAVSFALVAATGLGAWWLRLRARSLSRPTERALSELEDEQASLRAELEARLGEVEERLDFTERRLVQKDGRPSLPDPRGVVTPV